MQYSSHCLYVSKLLSFAPQPEYENDSQVLDFELKKKRVTYLLLLSSQFPGFLGC